MTDMYTALLDKLEHYNKNIAVINNKFTITYEELFLKGDKYANMILKYVDQDVKSGIICIVSNSTIEVIACILGILKAGYAFLVLDSGMPIERLNYMIDVLQPEMIFSDDIIQEYGSSLKKSHALDCITDVEEQLVRRERTKKSLAYIVFTSGTTGEPKAVMVEDKSILTYIQAYIKYFDIKSSDRIIQQSPVYYDGYCEEVFVALLSGAAVVVTDKKNFKNPKLMNKVINNYNVTIVPTTPLMLNELNKLEFNMFTVRAFVSSGDRLNSKHFCNIIKQCDVYNMYGATETTVCASVHKCTLDEIGDIPIGIPLDGYQFLLLDVDESNGIKEICIGGNGVTKGYMNDTHNDCFFYQGTQKYYKTGDYGEYDGKEYLYQGRGDRQIKVAGNRVNLSEIEKIYETNEKVDRSVALPIDERNRFVIFYQLKDIMDENNLHILEMLPGYMRPLREIPLQQIPVNEFGKPDCSKLVFCNP